MAEDTARDIVSTAAHLLNTRIPDGATPFNDGEILGFCQIAMRDIIIRLAERGVMSLKLESIQTVPALTVSLSDADGTLPPGLMQIIKMWERPSSTGQWTVVSMVANNLPPNAVMQTRLGLFEFRNNIIYFVGALGDVDVKIQYLCRLADLTMPDDVVGAPDLVNAIAYAAANLAQGGQNQYFEQQSQRAMQSVANLNAHSRQGRAFRMRRMRRNIPIGR